MHALFIKIQFLEFVYGQIPTWSLNIMIEMVCMQIMYQLGSPHTGWQCFRVTNISKNQPVPS